MAVAGLILGIISVLGFFVPILDVLTLILGIIGIAVSAKGRKKATAENKSTGMATAGLVLSIIGTSLSGIFVLCYACACAAGLAATGSILDGLGSLGDFGDFGDFSDIFDIFN